MKISGVSTVPANPERAWSLLQDPEALAGSIPGCEQLVLVGDGEYEMTMKMAVSSIQGVFRGTVRVADQNAPSSFRLLVEGNGKVGFIKGDGALLFRPSEAGTEVRYDGEVQVGGLLAGVGQRLLDVTAKFIIRKFFERMAARAAAGWERDRPGAY